MGRLGPVLEQIYSYLVAAHKKTRAEFLLSNPEPVFVVEPFIQDDRAKFHTTAGAGAPGTTHSIARVRKREGANAFGIMVTIGRAKNNDIELLAPDVSKFHAYLMQGPDGSWSITDAGSTYGTQVAGRRLQPKTDRVQLKVGDKVSVGSVAMTFLGPSEFYDYLKNPDRTREREVTPPELR